MTELHTAVELKPKRFQITIPQQLYDVLEALSEFDGYGSAKALVNQLISQYCSTKVIELRNDNGSTIHSIWDELFEQDIDDEMIKDVCKL